MNLMTIISPLVIIGLLGFLTTKRQWLTKVQIDAISKLTFNLCIPAFLFQQLAKAQLNNLDIQIYSAFYFPVLVVYGIAWLINFYFHNKYKGKSASSSIFALGASYSNTVIVGLPVILLVLGEQSLPIIFLIVTFHSAMLFGITSAFTARNKGFNGIKFLKQIFYNPLIIAISSGFLFNLSNMVLPSIVDNSLALLSKPAITLSLFLLGASLSFYKIGAEIKFILCGTVIKLFVLPSCVFLFSHYCLNLSTFTTSVVVLLSASPTGVNAYLIAKQQAAHQETVAGMVMLTTIGSIFTLPLWFWWLS